MLLDLKKMYLELLLKISLLYFKYIDFLLDI